MKRQEQKVGAVGRQEWQDVDASTCKRNLQHMARLLESMRESSADAAVGSAGTGILATSGASTAPAASVTESQLTIHAAVKRLWMLNITHKGSNHTAVASAR